ncbi:hypothetical protein QQP08_006593 [Theobroma cacao]|nr:hypothetical protein QQP08_006593 [Theobroma cacao]
MMQSDQKMLIEQLLIVLAKQVGEAVDQAKSFRIDRGEMEKRVVQLSQMLNNLVRFITMDPILFKLNPIDCVIREVSKILQEALTLACKCRRKTIVCRLFTGTRSKLDATLHKLYHLLDVSIESMKCLLILHNPDFGSAFDEIFLSLPQFLCNDSSTLSAWSCMVTEKLIWELAPMLSETSPPELKICCAEALSMLNVGSVLNSSRMIDETEELMFCLAKLVEAEDGEFQYNCLMIIMKITAAAESDLDLRCKTFKTNSPGAKAIVEQLLRVIKESADHPQLPAIKSIGSLARIFKERESPHVISVLVSQLVNVHQEVATEAIVALKKFAYPGSYLCKEHSKTMIEFNAVKPLMKLLRDGERTQQLHGLVLICYLAVNTDYSAAMEEARVRTAIKQLVTRKGSLHRHVVSQHPELKELVPNALRYLTFYYKY